MAESAHDISVIICAYTEDRRNDLFAAIETVQKQTLPPREIIVVIDHNPALLKQVQERVSGVVVVENTETHGLRGARNSGITVAQGKIIAFLDDDAVATPDWLTFLCEGYTDRRVRGGRLRHPGKVINPPGCRKNFTGSWVVIAYPTFRDCT